MFEGSGSWEKSIPGRGNAGRGGRRAVEGGSRRHVWGI